MRDIQGYIKDLKKKLSSSKEESIQTTDGIKSALIALFNNEAHIQSFISEYFTKKETLTIRTKNKVFASELYLNQSKILESVQKTRPEIKNIRII